MSPLLSKVIFNRSLIKSRQNWWGLFDTWLDLNATMTISEATLKQIKKIQQAKHIPLYNSFPMWFWCHFFFYWILISILPYFPFSSWFTKISSTQTRHRFFLPMLQTTNFLLSCLFWHMWYNCPKHPSPQKSTSETKKQYLNHCTSTPYWKSSRTCSSPRHPLFLHALSFECTSKLCINVLNRFSVYFHI